MCECVCCSKYSYFCPPLGQRAMTNGNSCCSNGQINLSSTKIVGPTFSYSPVHSRTLATHASSNFHRPEATQGNLWCCTFSYLFVVILVYCNAHASLCIRAELIGQFGKMCVYYNKHNRTCVHSLAWIDTAQTKICQQWIVCHNIQMNGPSACMWMARNGLSRSVRYNVEIILASHIPFGRLRIALQLFKSLTERVRVCTRAKHVISWNARIDLKRYASHSAIFFFLFFPIDMLG